MSVPIEEILSGALCLPPEARAFVAEKLIESLDAMPGAEVSPEWQEEVWRRCQEIDAGLVELRGAAELAAKAYDIVVSPSGSSFETIRGIATDIGRGEIVSEVRKSREL